MHNNQVTLSAKEETILRLLAEGCKNREIADSLGTTEHVVKNYLRLIYDKLGLWNRVELALWYLTHYEEAQPIGKQGSVA